MPKASLLFLLVFLIVCVKYFNFEKACFPESEHKIKYQVVKVLPGGSFCFGSKASPPRSPLTPIRKPWVLSQTQGLVLLGIWCPSPLWGHRVRGAKGSEGEQGSEVIEGYVILGFRVPTTCYHKKFDYHL